jgi:hypothetical protein
MICPVTVAPFQVVSSEMDSRADPLTCKLAAVISAYRDAASSPDSRPS